MKLDSLFPCSEGIIVRVNSMILCCVRRIMVMLISKLKLLL